MISKGYFLKVLHFSFNLLLQTDSFSNCAKCKGSIESFRLNKTFKIIESNHKPNTAKSSK